MTHPSPLTSDTVTLILAYLHHYDCKFLPSRGLSASNLQNLAEWVGQSDAGLRTVRSHRLLAAHLALLEAATLISPRSGAWVCLPTAFDWLHADHTLQIETLLKPLAQKELWENLLTKRNLSNTLTLDYWRFIEQVLERQQESEPVRNGRVSWEKCSDDGWNLELPPNLALPVLFHLLQIGDWSPGKPLRCTAVTLQAAAHRGYGLRTVETLLWRATGAELPEARSQELIDWLQRQDDYQLRTVCLLSVKQADQLARVLTSRRLANRVYEQISPRHAIVSADIVASLSRRLAEFGYYLKRPEANDDSSKGVLPDAAYAYLGMQVLNHLNQIIGAALRVPGNSLDAVEAQLSPDELAELDLRVAEIVRGVRQAIEGRDAFFPAEQQVAPEILETIRQAVYEEYELDIVYQSLVSTRPTARRVQPLRLEQRGDLYYMHAYCTLAEANRIFRLDRIHSCREAREEL